MLRYLLRRNGVQLVPLVHLQNLGVFDPMVHLENAIGESCPDFCCSGKMSEVFQSQSDALFCVYLRQHISGALFQ